MSAVRRNIRSGVGVQGVRGAVGELLAAALTGLEEAAEFGMDMSKEQCPIEPEARAPMEVHLRDTGHVDMDEERKRAKLSYDGPYAVYQHELLHLKHEHGGNAKFLEAPMLEFRNEFAEIIADRMREVTGG